MIIALEGPDKCGKTTLARWANLFDVKVVSYRPIGPRLFSCLPELERRNVETWEMFYDEGTVYVADRLDVVSGLVYGRVYGRPLLEFDFEWWFKRVFVVYVRVDVQELKRRLTKDGDELFDEKNYEAIVRGYEAEIQRWNHVIVTPDTVKEVLSATVTAETFRQGRPR